ncbi:hypothetical protein BASA81_014037 [Batrachochytrium salamandrivorans]|nr:hypothetical protein BASA81_014037 [Batrachochytrium salamandrivorans]
MKSFVGIRLLSAKPASSARQYGEVLFNEKLRKCASLSQVQLLLDAPVSGLGPGRCIRILNELGRFEPNPEVLEKLYSVAKTHQYTALETVQFCQALAELKLPQKRPQPVLPLHVPEFIVTSVREMDLDSFTSQSALDSLRTLERFPELGQLQSVRNLAKIAVEDLDDMSVSQICAMAKHLSPKQISNALVKRDFTPLSLVECWDVLALCGAEGNPELIAKLTTEAIQSSTKQFGIPRLARAFWHAGSPDKLFQHDEALKKLQDSQQDEDILKQVSLSEPPSSTEQLPRYLVGLLWDLAQMNFENTSASDLATSVAQEFQTCEIGSNVLDKNHMMQLLFSLAKFKIRNPIIMERILIELVQYKRLDEFNTPIELILMVWHFVKLGAHSPTFLDLASTKLNEMDLTQFVLTQKDLSMVLYAFSRFNYRNNELMDKFCVILQQPQSFEGSSAYHLLNLLDYFARMNYSSSPEARRLFLSIVDMMKTMPDLKDLSERDLSSLLRSLATLNIQDQDLTDRLVGGVLRKTNELEAKSASHLIHLLRDISVLQHSSKVDAIMPEIVKVLKQENSLVKLPSRELALLLQSFSKWGFFTDEELLQKITRELLNRGDELFKGDLKHLSWMLVNFGALWVKSGSVGEELLVASANELILRETLQEIDTSTITRFISAFDKFGYRNQELMIKLANELLKRDFSEFPGSSLHQIAKCFSKFKIRNVPLFEAIEKELLQRKDWSGFSRHALCEMAAALALFTKNSTPLFKRIAIEIKPTDSIGLKPKLIADICFAFAYTKVSDEVLFTGLATNLGEREDLESFSIQRLAVILWSFTILRQAERNRPLFERFSLHLQDRGDFREIVNDDLVSILSSFANAKIQDRALFNLASQLLQERDLSKFKERELANIVHSFGKVKHKDEVLFASLLKEISRRKSTDFTPTGLVQILRGFEVFDLAKGEWMEKLAKDMKRTRERVMV